MTRQSSGLVTLASPHESVEEFVHTLPSGQREAYNIAIIVTSMTLQNTMA